MTGVADKARRMPKLVIAGSLCINSRVTLPHVFLAPEAILWITNSKIYYSNKKIFQNEKFKQT